MIVGLLIGLVIGLAAGVAIGLVLRWRRNEGTLAEARVAQGRLSDSQAALARLSAQQEQAAASLAHLHADNVRLSTELDQARRGADERGRAWEEDRVSARRRLRSAVVGGTAVQQRAVPDARRLPAEGDSGGRAR